MIKVFLFMYICSTIPGNDCKPIPTLIEEFDSYHKCTIYGYNYSAKLLSDMGSDVVDTYRAFTIFDCKESSTI